MRGRCFCAMHKVISDGFRCLCTWLNGDFRMEIVKNGGSEFEIDILKFENLVMTHSISL